MNKGFSILGVTCAFGLLAGCVGTSVPENATKLGVFFTFADKHRCSDTSPTIRIGGAPEGTARYRVKMVDFTNPNIKIGGGTVEAKGGTIPEGALDSYKGPCARDGSHVYNVEVRALDASGRIIGFGENSERF